jgi:hypothetical protein
MVVDKNLGYAPTRLYLSENAMHLTQVKTYPVFRLLTLERPL